MPGEVFPIEGESKKRVVCIFSHVFLVLRSAVQWPRSCFCFLAFIDLRPWVRYGLLYRSATSLIRTSEVFIMVRGTRAYIFIALFRQYAGTHRLRHLYFPRMKPTRIRMCHSLVMNYGLYKRMEIFVSLKALGFCSTCMVTDTSCLGCLLQRAKPATKREMTQFHSDEYVDFLSKITPSNMNAFVKEQHKCKSYFSFTRLLFLWSETHWHCSS